MATQAVSSLLDVSTVGDAAVVTTGAFLGLLATLLPRKGALPIAFGVAGILGIVATVRGFVTDVDCSGTALTTRVAVIVVLAGSALMGLLIAAWRGGIRPVTPLAVFAVLEILSFLGQPFGVPILSNGGLTAVIPLAAAGLMGFFGALMPGRVIGLGAVSVGLATVSITAGYGTMCAAGPEPAPLLALIAFAAAFAVGSVVTVRRR